VGATVVDREAFDALPSELQRTLKETGKRAHAALRRKVRQMDEQAYQTILAGGVEEVDTSAHDAAWQSAYRKVRRTLRGSLVPASLLRQVEGS
jgi:TRAP-type C4-dicarboxylate transport system substrate-binding protein